MTLCDVLLKYYMFTESCVNCQHGGTVSVALPFLFMLRHHGLFLLFAEI